jgi:hypothetical protein
VLNNLVLACNSCNIIDLCTCKHFAPIDSNSPGTLVAPISQCTNGDPKLEATGRRNRKAKRTAAGLSGFRRTNPEMGRLCGADPSARRVRPFFVDRLSFCTKRVSPGTDATQRRRGLLGFELHDGTLGNVRRTWSHLVHGRIGHKHRSIRSGFRSKGDLPLELVTGRRRLRGARRGRDVRLSS